MQRLSKHAAMTSPEVRPASSSSKSKKIGAILFLQLWDEGGIMGHAVSKREL
jgi:hypothetical protein